MNQNPNMNRPSKPDGDGREKSLLDDAKSAASNVAEQAREQASSKLGAQKDKAVETIGNVADAIRGAGDKLKDQGPLPQLADQAADSIESVANYFRTRNVGDLIGEVERFARREPAIFLGASFAIGLLGGRFLKSSKAKSHQSQQMEQGHARAFDDDRSFQARTPRSAMTTPAYGSGYRPEPPPRVAPPMTQGGSFETSTAKQPAMGGSIGVSGGVQPSVPKPVGAPTNTLPGTGGASSAKTPSTQGSGGGNRGGMGQV